MTVALGPNPGPAWRDGSWDRLYFGDILVPGRVATFTITVRRNVEKTKPKGTDTPHTKDDGYDGAEIALVQEIWKAADYERLAEIVNVLSPRQPGALAAPFIIVHPLAALHNVSEVYLTELSTDMPAESRWLVSMKLWEWFPPEAVVPTKQGKAPPKGGGSGKQPGASDDLGGFDVPPPDPANVGGDFP